MERRRRSSGRRRRKTGRGLPYVYKNRIILDKNIKQVKELFQNF